MRDAAALLAILCLAGCGSVEAPRDSGGARPVAGLGIEASPPAGWSTRILLGTAGRPLLHAANFALPANDDDTGSVAQQIIGSARMAYVNVRDLGAGSAEAALPVSFERSDFGPPQRPDYRCCFITAASRDVAVAGRRFRVTAIAGSDDPPGERLLGSVNAFLSTLALMPYEPADVEPARDGRPLNGYGIHLALPAGWDGRVSHGTVELAGRGLALTLYENGGSDAPFATARVPLRLVPTEFVPPETGTSDTAAAVTGRSFVTAGRRFVLRASAASSPPPARAVAQANAALATLRVKPGDFYPGTVEPASFAAAPGWHTGTSGPAEVGPASEATSSWASSVPYRDEPDALPQTLASLPPDGIVVHVWLERSHRRTRSPPARKPRFDLAEAERGPFEGVPRDGVAYRFAVHAPGGYHVTLRFYFGRAEPTKEQLARAQAQLDRLRLPDWRDSS